MKSIRTNVILAVGTLLSLGVATGADAQLAIRQSFTAASQQGKPAAFLWTTESKDDAEAADFAAIDAAVRYSFQGDPGVGILIGGPTVEWHKLTRAEEESDRISAGGSGEFIVGGIALGWFGSPYLTGDLMYEVDRERDESGVEYSAAISMSSTSRFAPGNRTSLWAGSMLRWNPHLGVERHAAVSEVIGDATTGFFKLNGELWPYMDRFYVQLLASYTAAMELGGSGLPEDLNRASFSLNVFLDPGQNIGFGIEYETGRQPDDAFVDLERTTFGFKVKL